MQPGLNSHPVDVDRGQGTGGYCLAEQGPGGVGLLRQEHLPLGWVPEGTEFQGHKESDGRCVRERQPHR